MLRFRVDIYRSHSGAGTDEHIDEFYVDAEDEGAAIDAVSGRFPDKRYGYEATEVDEDGDAIDEPFTCEADGCGKRGDIEDSVRVGGGLLCVTCAAMGRVAR